MTLQVIKQHDGSVSYELINPLIVVRNLLSCNQCVLRPNDGKIVDLIMTLILFYLTQNFLDMCFSVFNMKSDTKRHYS